MTSTRNTPQRSRAACYSCRSRKQKCDGEKPRCKRCRVSNQDCTWPVTQKRGPAKGFAVALEHRLEETEKALLYILSVVDDDTLSTAFAHTAGFSWNCQAPPIENSTQSRPSPDNTAMMTPAESRGNSIMDQWEHYPLNKPEALRTWARCYKRKSPESVSMGDPETPTRPAARSVDDQQGKNSPPPSSPPSQPNCIVDGYSRQSPDIHRNVVAPTQHGDDEISLTTPFCPPASRHCQEQGRIGNHNDKSGFKAADITTMAIDSGPPPSRSDWTINCNGVDGGGESVGNSLNIPIEFQKQFVW